MTDNSELKRLAEALLASDDHADFPGWMAVSDAFDNATGPAAVLALIAENEHLAMCARQWEEAAMQWGAERDQLKAENETLIAAAQALRDEWRKDQAGAERYRWLREARSGYIEVVEWIGPHATGMVGEDLDALLDAAMGKGERS